MRYFLLLCLLLCLTIPLHAQDNPTPYDIALQHIEEAASNGATELDLSNLGLTELPTAIAQLTQLQRLSLSYNQLVGLPGEIGQLSNLQALDLYGNRLTNIPSGIFQLTSRGRTIRRRRLRTR